MTFIEVDYLSSHFINVYFQLFSIPLVIVIIIGKIFFPVFVNKSDN